MRTTLDIAAPILREIKRIQKRTGRSLGTIASELMAQSLDRQVSSTEQSDWIWVARRMGSPRVDLRDKEAVRRALEEAPAGARR